MLFKRKVIGGILGDWFIYKLKVVRSVTRPLNYTLDNVVREPLERFLSRRAY